MTNMLNLMKQDNPDEYKEIMNTFITSAKANDINSMINITSDLTIKNIGLEKLKTHYTNDSVPVLKMCKPFSTGGDVIHVTKEETGTGPGWVFRKVCHYKKDKKAVLQFVILNEQGRLVLASFGMLQ